MRVAIEAASLSISSGGLPRYTGELSLALARCHPEDAFFLVSDQPFAMPPGCPPNLTRGGGPRSAPERKWWLWGLGSEAHRLRADLIHGPDFAVPYFPRKASVMTLHDLSPWMDSHWHHAAGRVKRRAPVLLKLEIPTMVITHSETVRKEAIERFRIAPARIVAIPPAAPSWLRPVKTKPARAYFLFVGTMEPRKNVPAIVEAWREVRREHDVDLVLAGRRRADAPAMEPEPGMKILGEVADDQLAELYSGALAFLYPSFYEGFGLPVLEAMQCGAPVIASRAVAEAGGDAAVYVQGAGELAQAMKDAIRRPEFVAELGARSLARAAGFSWERTARLTYAVYEEALQRFGQ